jgi:hypothetical protein
MMILMFCCGGALEAQHTGTRAAANKGKNKRSGSLLRARRATADARRGNGGGVEGGGSEDRGRVGGELIPLK